jgi:hypothetical protein
VSEKPKWTGTPGENYVEPTAKDRVLYFLFAVGMSFGIMCLGFFVLCFGTWMAQ